MTCCKCEEHEWGDKPTNCTTYDGVEYCIFHNPHKKGIDSEAFNKLVTERVLSTGKANRSVDLSGTIFPCNFIFSTHFDTEMDYTIDLKDSVFRGDADFSGAKLNISDFTGAKFEKKAIFKNVHFLSDISFDDSKFLGTSTFENSIFFKTAIFNNSTFFGKSNFSNADFYGEANFGEATFQKRCLFRKAKFYSTASFMFTSFLSESLFKSASFFGETNFITTEFGANVYFFNNTFSGVTIFMSSNISKRMYIVDPEIVSGTISLSGLYAGSSSVRIRGLNSKMMLNLFFMGLDVDYLSFLSCEWPDQLKISNDKNENTMMQEDIYRRLKQKASTEHDQPMVSKWHYREKMMALEQLKKSDGWRPILSITWWYFVCSGFGEEPTVAFKFLLKLFAVAFFSLCCFKLLETSWSPQPDWTKIFEIPAETLALIPLVKSGAVADPSSVSLVIPIKRFFVGLMQIAVSVQIALFAFALRNRFRR